jgi:hypothetical protein
LVKKLDNAAAAKEAGLRAYTAGKPRLARVLWLAAITHMRCFIQEVEALSRGRNPKLPRPIAERWIAQAETIIEGLRGLPGAVPAQDLPAPRVPPPPPPPVGTPTDPPPAYQYVPWPVDVLPPYCYTSFVVSGVPPGFGLILSGAIFDGGGSDFVRLAAAVGDGDSMPILTWMEEVVTPPHRDTTPPVITDASADPPDLRADYESEGGEGGNMTDMTLSVYVQDDDPYATWYVADVASAPAQAWWAGWELDPNNPQALRLRGWGGGEQYAVGPQAAAPPEDGEETEYLVTVRARDRAGNVSAPHVIHVPVYISERYGTGGQVQITSVVAAPTGAGAVQIVFALTSAAEVEAQVVNIAGRPVKTLVSDRSCPKGSNSLLWNCSSDRGLRVPSGTYLIRLTAHTADGQQVSRVCPVNVRR